MSGLSVRVRSALCSYLLVLLVLPVAPSGCDEDTLGRGGESAFLLESAPELASDLPIGAVSRVRVERVRPSAEGYAERVSAMVEILGGDPLPDFGELDAETQAAFEGAADGEMTNSQLLSLDGGMSARLRGDYPHIEVALLDGPRPKLGEVEPEGIGRDLSLRLARECADALAQFGVVEPFSYDPEPVHESVEATQLGGESLISQYNFSFQQVVSGIHLDDTGLRVQVDPHTQRCTKLGLWLAETELLSEVELPVSPDQAHAAAEAYVADMGEVMDVEGAVSYRLGVEETVGVVEPRYLGEYAVELQDMPIPRLGRFGVVLSETPAVASDL